MIDKTINFDSELLSIMAKSKENTLREMKNDFESTNNELQNILREVPGNIRPMVIEAMIRSMKDEEEAKEFSKKLVYSCRLFHSIEEIEKEVMVIHSVLDENSMLRMASGIDFTGY